MFFYDHRVGIGLMRTRTNHCILCFMRFYWNCCFRWRVSPTPSSTSTPAPSIPSSSEAKPSKTSSVKRERSVPPEKQQEKEEDEEEAISDTELMGSPKKRKKTGLFDGHLLEKVNNYPSPGETSEPAELQFLGIKFLTFSRLLVWARMCGAWGASSATRSSNLKRSRLKRLLPLLARPPPLIRYSPNWLLELFVCPTLSCPG